MFNRCLNLFKLPEVKKIEDLDSTLSNDVHRNIILKKPFLKKLYLDYYKEFENALMKLPKGYLVEIGSGAGFLKEVIPDVITTDVFEGASIDKVLNAEVLPFEDESVSAFFLLNVLHHINKSILFFKEAKRCLINGGKIIMIEPYCSVWGEFIFGNFHHELLDKDANWEVSKGGRLTSANLALAWIIFFRDRNVFENMFPELKITKLVPHTSFRYIISGGLSFKQLLPSFTYDLIKGIEDILSPLNKYIGLFVSIELKKG